MNYSLSILGYNLIYSCFPLTGGHLVAGYNADRVRANGAAESRDDAHARPPQDTKERASLARPALALESRLQRLHRLRTSQGNCVMTPMCVML